MTPDMVSVTYSFPYIGVFLTLLVLALPLQAGGTATAHNGMERQLGVFVLLFFFIGLRGFIFSDWRSYHSFFEAAPTLFSGTDTIAQFVQTGIFCLGKRLCLLLHPDKDYLRKLFLLAGTLLCHRFFCAPLVVFHLCSRADLPVLCIFLCIRTHPAGKPNAEYKGGTIVHNFPAVCGIKKDCSVLAIEWSRMPLPYLIHYFSAIVFYPDKKAFTEVHPNYWTL